MSNANYSIIEDIDSRIVLRDVGPWGEFKTITNDAEGVVADFVNHLKGRKLYYYDSEDDLCELVVVDGRFYGYLDVKELPELPEAAAE